MADPNQAQASLPQYDVLRRRLQQQSDKDKLKQEEDIKRRFASQGLLNSGAYLKGQERGAKDIQEATSKGLEDIGFQETQELQRQKEVGEARQYQTSEREASQAFASGERNQSQIFNKDLFNQDLAFKNLVQSQNFGLASQEAEESKRSNFANFALALKTAGLTDPNEVDQLFAKAGEIFGRINPSFGGGTPGIGSSGAGAPPTSGAKPSAGQAPGQFYTPPSTAEVDKQKAQTSNDFINGLVDAALKSSPFGNRDWAVQQAKMLQSQFTPDQLLAIQKNPSFSRDFSKLLGLNANDPAISYFKRAHGM